MKIEDENRVGRVPFTSISHGEVFKISEDCSPFIRMVGVETKKPGVVNAVNMSSGCVIYVDPDKSVIPCRRSVVVVKQ